MQDLNPGGMQCRARCYIPPGFAIFHVNEHVTNIASRWDWRFLCDGHCYQYFIPLGFWGLLYLDPFIDFIQFTSGHILMPFD